MAQTIIVGAMDPYWGSLHCVCTLMVPPYPDVLYKWVLVTEQWGQGAAEITSIMCF